MEPSKKTETQAKVDDSSEIWPQHVHDVFVVAYNKYKHMGSKNRIAGKGQNQLIAAYIGETLDVVRSVTQVASHKTLYQKKLQKLPE